ncbi:MAG: tetratricopeptide repeat protein, partial [Candidatus Krumholzibacteria bacterium]|nr:tetratricopeptide repeat protein [Candidatus Krumholzibacteria bacterium]
MGGSLGEIAGKLGVATVLEGSVQQAGGRVHLAVRLIDARSDDYIWSQEYDRGMEDVFAVQADVALNVADRLRATLTSEVEGRIETSPTENIEAYKLLMRGRDIWNRATHEDRLEAIRLFEQASEAAPDYADAYARLADAYRLITLYGYLPPEQMIPKAKEYARKALAIDEGNVLAHATLSGIAGHHEWKWKESERLCLRAIELNPGDAGCHAAYAWDLMLRGRFDEAVAEQRKALELDPLSVGHRQNEGEILYYARRYDESIEASRRAIEMNPNYPQSRMFMGASYLGKGMREEALAALAQEQELSRGTRPEVENWIGFAYAMAGEKEKARAVLDHLLEMSKERWVSPFVIATIYVGLGEQDRGFEWLGKAYEERDSRLAYLKVHPVYDIVKSDPRYLAMLERVGLAE